MSDFWDSIPAVDRLRGEGNVEHRLVLPLLHALGYEDHEIESKYPVVFQQGRRGASRKAISFASTARSTTATIRFSSSRRNSPERSYPRAKRRASRTPRTCVRRSSC